MNLQHSRRRIVDHSLYLYCNYESFFQDRRRCRRRCLTLKHVSQENDTISGLVCWTFHFLFSDCMEYRSHKRMYTCRTVAQTRSGWRQWSRLSCMITQCSWPFVHSCPLHSQGDGDYHSHIHPTPSVCILNSCHWRSIGDTQCRLVSTFSQTTSQTEI